MERSTSKIPMPLGTHTAVRSERPPSIQTGDLPVGAPRENHIVRIYPVETVVDVVPGNAPVHDALRRKFGQQPAET